MKTIIHLHIPNVKEISIGGQPKSTFMKPSHDDKICITLEDDGRLFIGVTDSECPKGP